MVEDLKSYAQYCAPEGFFPPITFCFPSRINNHQTKSQSFLSGNEPCSTILERSIHLNTRYCLETRNMLISGPFFLIISGNYPLTQFQLSICDIEPCSTISEISIHLHTSYCHKTRTKSCFLPLFLAPIS